VRTREHLFNEVDKCPAASLRTNIARPKMKMAVADSKEVAELCSYNGWTGAAMGVRAYQQIR
jgi:hypothetical protein